MKIKNILSLVITLVGFVACTSESEIIDTPVSGELVPVIINLGSPQTKSVTLDDGEGTIQNAVIGIFDSKGIPTVAPIELSGPTSGSFRIPLVESNAYAFVNISAEDIAALKAIGNENDFKNYSITKPLTQTASELPKYGAKLNFTPTDNGQINIDVKQLTARLDVSVDVVVMENGEDVTDQHPEITFSASSVKWTGVSNKGNGVVNGNMGDFTTTIDKDYDVFNRAYSYAGATPTLELSGQVDSKDCNYSYTFKEGLNADHVYVILMKATVDLEKGTTVTLNYEVVKEGSFTFNIPSFD